MAEDKATREETERAHCPACIGKRLHTAEEWKNHPMAGHGRIEHGWTHPVLEQEAA